MKRIAFSFLAVAILAVGFALANWAQQPATPLCKSPYYETFNQPFLSPSKWIPNGPACGQWLTLECVREIQNNRLRLALRNIGAMDSNVGSQFSYTDLNFVNPNTITGITADVALTRYSGISCPANGDQPSRTIVKVAGAFFNTGSGDPADDVTDDLYLWVDPTDPKTMQVANWMTGGGAGVSTPIASYPIGTPLTLTNIWDKTNHQFISIVHPVGELRPINKVIVPYSSFYNSDSLAPVNPYKSFFALVYSQNCTSIQTQSYVEAFFDNVMINVPLRAE